MKEVSLPSGAVLKVTAAPFKDSKALYQACLEELKDLNLDPKQEIDANFFKGLFCVGFSSKKIESALYKCFERCTYNGSRIVDDSIFESVEARDDYFTVCFEVAKENIMPFTKSLSVKYAHILGELTNIKGPA